MIKIIISSEKLHNIFQPIFQVDHEMNAKVNTHEMLMRDSSGAFPGMEFLNSLTTPEGNEQWISISKKSLADALTAHPQRKIYINLEPCQMEFDSVWQFLEEIHEQYGSQVAIDITERRETIHSLDYLMKRFSG